MYFSQIIDIEFKKIIDIKTTTSQIYLFSEKCEILNYATSKTFF